MIDQAPNNPPAVPALAVDFDGDGRRIDLPPPNVPGGYEDRGADERP
jgi:hypothetical protein